jgi:subtilisin family serine protease
MTYSFAAQSPRTLLRRGLCSAGLLLSLMMATTNIVGAFATETTLPPATVSADTASEIISGNSTVIVTLDSNDVKDDVISELSNVVTGKINNELAAIPVITIDNVSATQLDAIAAVEGVVGVEPNRTLELANAEHLSATQGLNVVPTGSTTPLRGTGMRIGILDSGINIDHPAFKNDAGQSRVISLGCNADPNPVAPCNTTPARAAHLVCDISDPNVQGGCYHGTAVADMAAGRRIANQLTNGQTWFTGGVAPEATIVFSRVAIPQDGTITYETFLGGLDRLVAAVVNKSPNAPHVVNISFAFPSAQLPSCEANLAAKTAIDLLSNSGVPVAIASGNDGTKNRLSYPACLSSAIAVGATNAVVNADGSVTSETVSSFSNSSAELDIVAPGEGLASQLPNPEQFARIAGTSFAAPLVSGSIALLKQAKPSLTTAQVKSALYNNADSVRDPAINQTFKRLNVQKAVASVSAAPAPTTTTTRPTTATLPTVPTTAPTTVTTQPVTTSSTVPPNPNAMVRAEVNVTASRAKAFFADFIDFTVDIKNTGDAPISNLDVKIFTTGRELKVITIPNVPVGTSTIPVFQDSLEAGRFVTLIDEETMEIDFTGDFSATICWSTNTCVSDSTPVEVVDAVLTFAWDTSTDGTNVLEISNIGSTTITNLKVTEATYGDIDFGQTTIEPGETLTTDWEIEPVEGLTEITFTATGTVDGMNGTLFRYSTSDIDEDPSTTTTVVPAPTTAPVNVGGEQVERTSATGEELPFTGSSQEVLYAGIWLLLAGVMLLSFKEGFARRAVVRVRR